MKHKLLAPENWIKLGAVLLAVLLWLNVAVRTTYEYSMPVPLELTKIPPNLILAEPVPDQVVVRIEATGRDLILFRFGKPKMVVNSGGLRRGTNPVSLKATSLTMPQGVVFQTAEVEEPKVISVELDRILIKQAPVDKNVEISLREGWVIVGEPRIAPEEIKVKGPYQWVRNIKSVGTDTIRMDRVSGNVAVDLPLVNDNFNVTFTPAAITYTAQVERLAERTIKDIPVVLLRVPDDIEAVLDEPFIALTVQGGESQVSRLTKQDIEVTLDYPRIARYPTKQFAATIKVPENIKWVKAEPKRFGLKEKIILKRNLKKR